MWFVLCLVLLLGCFCEVASSFLPCPHTTGPVVVGSPATCNTHPSCCCYTLSSVLALKTPRSATRTTKDEEIDVGYDWREFKPKPGAGIWKNLQWLVSGSSRAAQQSDAKMRNNLAKLARMLVLLRAYQEQYGMPTSNTTDEDDEFGGGPQRVQRRVVSDLVKELYQSGAPTWVLEPVMERVAEGLSGNTGVQFFILPRRTFIFYPYTSTSMPSKKNSSSGTDMFKTQSGFYMHRLGAVEPVAVRLASFASNTKSVERLSSGAFRMPRTNELFQAEQEAEEESIMSSVSSSVDLRNENPSTADELAQEILDLASETYGLFYFLNSRQFQAAVKAFECATEEEFWGVEESTREVFTRLAANEASRSIAKIRREDKELYAPWVTTLFRFLSSAGASAMWFGGSLPDMLVAGILAEVVGSIGRSMVVFEERILTEVVSSAVVGFAAGVLSLTWPRQFCFGAIAIPATLELMQGFKVVYAVIEVMSRNIVAGCSRMLEGILFTGLISYNLKFGLDAAFRLVCGPNAPFPKDVSPFLISFNPIAKVWIVALVPLASFAWSGLFRPSYVNLPAMMFHGTLAFTLNALGASSFAAALCVTFSAGLLSRFTGREALSNTLAGLYALVPGAFLVKGMFLASTTTGDFLQNVVAESVKIGLGAWTGTILCSPTILGKTSGLHGRRLSDKRRKSRALLYF